MKQILIENSRSGPKPRLHVLANKMVRLYQSGLSLKQVGKRLGCSGWAVSVYLKKAGVPRRPAGRGHKWTPERCAALAQDYLNGMPTTSIAVKYGCQQPNVVKYLLQAGVEPNRQTKKWRRKKRAQAAK